MACCRRPSNIPITPGSSAFNITPSSSLAPSSLIRSSPHLSPPPFIRAVWYNACGDGKTAPMTATDFRIRYALALFWGLFLLAQQAWAFDPAILGQAERAAVSLRQDLT